MNVLPYFLLSSEVTASFASKHFNEQVESFQHSCTILGTMTRLEGGSSAIIHSLFFSVLRLAPFFQKIFMANGLRKCLRPSGLKRISAPVGLAFRWEQQANSFARCVFCLHFVCQCCGAALKLFFMCLWGGPITCYRA